MKSIASVLLLACSSFAQMYPGVGPPSNHSGGGGGGFSFTKTITVSHTMISGPSDLSNYTVSIPLDGTLLQASLKSTGNGGVVTDAQGDDIVLTSDSGCTTPLTYELEAWIPTTGATYFHVPRTSFSHTVDTVIYLCAGKASITTFQGGSAGAAWASSFKGVWHFPDGATLGVNDSTSNANNGTNTGSPLAASGKVDGAILYNGSGQYTTVGNGSSLQITGNITIESWVNLTDNANYYWVLSKTSANVTAPYEYRVEQSNGVQRLLLGGSGVYSQAASATGVPTGGWHHIAAVWSGGSTVDFYLDGALDKSATLNGGVPTLIDGGTPAQIGTRNDFYSTFNGSMDELRILNVARTADEIATDYNNQSSPATYISVI